MVKKNKQFLKVLMEFCGCTFFERFQPANVFYSRIYQPNLVLKYEKEMYIYIPTDATFEDVQRILSESGVVQKTSSFHGLQSKKDTYTV